MISKCLTEKCPKLNVSVQSRRWRNVRCATPTCQGCVQHPCKPHGTCRGIRSCSADRASVYGPDYQNSLLPLGSASGLVHHGMYRLLVDGAWCCRSVDDTAWNLFVCSSDHMLDAGGTTDVLQHDFPCSRDVCPVGAGVAVNISRRI